MLVVDGIVLRTLKYGETSLILDLYTKEKGLVSCIAGGVRKRRTSLPAAALQLLQIVQATIYYKDSDKLNRIKDVRVLVHNSDLIDDPLKRIIIIFLAEVLQKSIKEKEMRPELYSFIHDSLSTLNNISSGVANFHLVFMLRLSKFLGFFPRDNHTEENCWFDLEDGGFTDLPEPRKTLGKEESLQLTALMKSQYGDPAGDLLGHSSERKMALESLISYFQYHVEGFGQLKTPEILHVILS